MIFHDSIAAATIATICLSGSVSLSAGKVLPMFMFKSTFTHPGSLVPADEGRSIFCMFGLLSLGIRYEGEADEDGDVDSETDEEGEVDADGERDAEGDPDADGEVEANAYVDILLSIFTSNI